MAPAFSSNLLSSNSSSASSPFKSSYNAMALSLQQGFLTDANCSQIQFTIKTTPIANDYDVEKKAFARGKFAVVRRCKHRVTGKRYATKTIKKRRRQVDVRHEILHEVRVLLMSADNPHIINLYEVYETPNEMILVLEMAEGGELQRVLDEEDAIPEAQTRQLLRQILVGLEYLHSKNIAHLDIKPQNLLLTSAFPNGDVKLCDFGISRVITPGTEVREINGTPDYVAPEVLNFDPISLKTDMWSLGILTYVLLTGYSPFGGDTKQQTYCNITTASLDFPPTLFGEISEDAIDFIKKLIVRNPKGRMSCQECLEHPWLAKCTLTAQIPAQLSPISNDITSMNAEPTVAATTTPLTTTTTPPTSTPSKQQSQPLVSVDPTGVGEPNLKNGNPEIVCNGVNGVKGVADIDVNNLNHNHETLENQENDRHNHQKENGHVPNGHSTTNGLHQNGTDSPPPTTNGEKIDWYLGEKNKEHPSSPMLPLTLTTQ